MIRLRWKDLTQGPPVHVQEAFYPPGHAFRVHDHDFAEIFLVLSGSAWHHGRDQRPASSGSVCLVAPDLAHHLAAGPDEACAFLNIAFPAHLLRRLLRDYPDLTDLWSRQWPPRHLSLGDADRRAVQDWADLLRHPGVDDLDVHAFLLDLCRRLRRPRCEGGTEAPPPWLLDAIETASTPSGFAEGVAAYARLSGRGTAHINRLIRRYFGVTANQLCNRRRMDHAALRLRHSADPIPAIVSACGFAAPAQFYRRFKERFGMGPAAYRDAGRAQAL